MDLEVVGRHALLFDDDSAAAFVNSSEALVEWNSLSIDRYDVRHLLPGPPPPRKRRRSSSSSSPPHPDASLVSELDHERYLDLPPPPDEDEQDTGNGGESAVAGDFHAVAFSYRNPDESNDQQSDGAECSFRPPFPVPESLLQNLPPTEKVHQIIARTATFVSKHGGQTEIVLRVKQGNNPTFGFLMPDHHHHAYFRYLVVHQELLEYDTDGKFREEKKSDSGLNQTSGALSLLGSLYGYGEDEDGGTEDAPNPRINRIEEAVDAVNSTVCQGPEQMEPSQNKAGKDEVDPKKPVPLLKEKALTIKQNRSISTVKGGNTTKKGDALGLHSATIDKSQPSALPSSSKVQPPIVGPPSDIKRVIDKIVEFIQKNGKQFESVLAEQDRSHGRFPFLLPSNQYHSYYLSVLQKSHKSKLPGKAFISDNHDAVDKKTAKSKDGDGMSLASTGCDIPCDYERKEKFKMVLGKTKRDGQDPPSKPIQPPAGVTVDAASAAAILQAATRGIKNPDLEIFQKTSSSVQGLSSGHASSFGSLHSSQLRSSVPKSDQKRDSGVSVPVAKAIAETASIAAASEADSSEASLTKEQKLKAERLKRAKMFAAMIKTGAAPLQTEPLHGSSLEPLNHKSKEREGSSVLFDVSDKYERSDIKITVDEFSERRSRRRYRSRTERNNDGDDLDEIEKDEEDEEDKRDHKRSRKKHRSHRSSRHSRDRHKHSRRRSSKDRDSQSSHKHRHDTSSEDEHRNSRSKRKNDYTSGNEDPHVSESLKNRRSYSTGEAELEEGEISTKSDPSKASELDAASRETSVDLTKPYQNGRAPSEPSRTSEISDDLRAKIRAMLMATL